MAQSLKKFQEQYEFLCQITNSRAFKEGQLGKLNRLITKEVSLMLGVKSVGIWWVDDSAIELRLSCGYDMETDEFTAGDVLDLSTSPRYLNAILRNRSVIVDDVETSPATKELLETYLRPFGVTSMLDTGIRMGEKTVGILRLEHVGPKRQWTLEEVNFAGALSDLISNVRALNMATEAEIKYKSAVDKLKESNITLKNVLDKIEDERQSTHETIAHNIEVSVKPLLEELKETADPHQEKLLRQLEFQVDSLTSDFFRNLAVLNSSLTPMEIKVIDLVRTGLRAKEIAEDLRLSVATVETHKKNIRKKLNLTNKSVNLKAYLDMISHDRLIGG